METTSRVKQIRSATGLSQRAFAERYGIPRRTIEDWESNQHDPPAYVLDLLQFRVDHDEQP